MKREYRVYKALRHEALWTVHEDYTTHGEAFKEADKLEEQGFDVKVKQVSE